MHGNNEPIHVAAFKLGDDFMHQVLGQFRG